MTNLALLATAAVPRTVEWGPQVAVVMIVCNIMAIAFGKATMKSQTVGPAMPSPQFFGGMGLPAVLATTSLGHVIGIGAILGLAGMGIL
ncbi:MAG: photosystem I reaction center subunit PsaK [Cyanobacteria bacterium P01_D01_bin.105]